MFDSIRRGAANLLTRGISEAVGESVTPNPRWDQDTAPGWNPVGETSQSRLQTPFSGAGAKSWNDTFQACVRLFERNPVAKAIVNLTSGYTLSDTIRYAAVEKSVGEVLEEFWTSEWNNWDDAIFTRVRELGVYGEQLWPLLVNPANGFVQVAYILPSRVKKVTMSAISPERVDAIELVSPDGVSEGPKFRIVNGTPFEEALPAGFIADAFYLRANALAGRPRGQSDLLVVADWLEALDDLGFNAVERAAQELDWTKHISAPVGTSVADQEEIKRQLRDKRPGSEVFTLGDVEIRPIVPQLASAESAATARMTINMIAGGAGVAPHMLGWVEDSNRATAEAVNAPMLKVLQTRRREIASAFTRLGKYVISRAVEWGRLPIGVDQTFSVELPDIAEKDRSSYSRGLLEVVNATMGAYAADMMTLRTALRLISEYTEDMGVAVDVEEELKELALVGYQDGDGIDDET